MVISDTLGVNLLNNLSANKISVFVAGKLHKKKLEFSCIVSKRGQFLHWPQKTHEMIAACRF
jgi:hypothetical protein